MPMIDCSLNGKINTTSHQIISWTISHKLSSYLDLKDPLSRSELDNFAEIFVCFMHNLLLEFVMMNYITEALTVWVIGIMRNW
jgi:hypothetical protein